MLHNYTFTHMQTRKAKMFPRRLIMRKNDKLLHTTLR